MGLVSVEISPCCFWSLQLRGPQEWLHLQPLPLRQPVLAPRTRLPQLALPQGAPPSLHPLNPPPQMCSSLSSWGTCWGLQGQVLEGLAWLLPPSLWRCLVSLPFSRA